MSVSDHGLITDIARDNSHASPTGEDHRIAQEQMLVMLFIRGTNSQHKQYLQHLWNSYSGGNNNYVQTVHSAYNILQQQVNTTPQTLGKMMVLQLHNQAPLPEMVMHLHR